MTTVTARRVVSVLLVLLATLGLGACGTLAPLKKNLYRDYSPEPLAEHVSDNAYTKLRDAVKKGIFNKQDTCFTTSATDDTCHAGRTIMVSTLEAASNDVCRQHLMTIYGNQAATNLTLGTLSLGASVAGTVAGGETIKSILAAFASFFTGEQTLINSVVYKEVVVPAVVKNILEMRAAKLKEIEAHRDDDITKYPVPSALSDILEYHESCSFLLGLQRALDGSQGAVRERKVVVMQGRIRDLQLQIDARIRALTRAGKSPAERLEDNDLNQLKKDLKTTQDNLYKLQMDRSASPPASDT